MIDGLTNSGFLTHVGELATAKKRGSIAKLYKLNGAFVVTTKKPPNSQEIKFDALLDEAEKRTSLSPLEKKNLANHIRALSKVEARTWTQTLQRPINFLKNKLTRAGQKEKSRGEQVVEKLDLSARNEAASTIQKAFRKKRETKAARTIQKAFRKSQVRKITSIKNDETTLQKIWRIIKSIFNSFLELFRWSPKIKREKEMEPLVEEEVAVQPTKINELKDQITRKLNSEYASFFDKLGKKEGCPDFKPPKFENDTLIIQQSEASKLAFSYYISGTVSIPEELKMHYEIKGSKAIITLEPKVSVTTKILFMGEKTYVIDRFILEKEKFSIVLKNESEERVIERPVDQIAGMSDSLTWAS